MLDPTHLAIVYEYDFWNKKSSGSKQLRRILSKCCAVGPRNQRTFLGDLYNGAVSRPLTPSKSEARSLILNCSMLKTEVDEILNNLDLDTPFRSRLEFIQLLAALCSRFSREVARKAPGPNKEIFKILWSACAPDRIEWLMNNVRSRRIIPDAYLQLIPSGTAGNESLHAEINSWSKSTHALHRSTLAIRLRYYNYIKMLMHHLASKHPLSHIVTAQMLLGRSLHDMSLTGQMKSGFPGARNRRRTAPFKRHPCRSPQLELTRHVSPKSGVPNGPPRIMPKRLQSLNIVLHLLWKENTRCEPQAWSLTAKIIKATWLHWHPFIASENMRNCATWLVMRL